LSDGFEKKSEGKKALGYLREGTKSPPTQKKSRGASPGNRETKKKRHGIGEEKRLD